VRYLVVTYSSCIVHAKYLAETFIVLLRTPLMVNDLLFSAFLHMYLCSLEEWFS
jgi:hypothetical protein